MQEWVFKTYFLIYWYRHFKSAMTPHITADWTQTLGWCGLAGFLQVPKFYVKVGE